ncbi:MAG: hypothetical protein QXH42_08215 [Thermoplasmata archaeon]
MKARGWRKGRCIGFSALGWGAVTAFLLFSACASTSNAEPSGNVGDSALVVDVGIYVLSFGNHDTNKGTFTLDFYLWFIYNESAAEPNFTVAGFEFMNGRAGSKEKIFDSINSDTGMREVWYRIQASLYYKPTFRDYPFDRQEFSVLVEDTARPLERLVYRPLADRSGWDPGAEIPGWRVDSVTYTSSVHSYPWGERYSRFAMSVVISREPLSTGIKSILPPVIFCIVSGLSFFFTPDKIANRIGFGTSMLISAVMFHVSQTGSLPPLGSLILIDKIMIAAYSFLFMSLFVTTLIYINDQYWKHRDYTKEFNRWGGVVSVVLPFIVYALLVLV